MSRGTLQKLKPIRSDLRPPQDAVAAGTTPDGKQVYRLVTKRSRSKPRLDPGTGERLFRKHPLTGEPLIPLREPEVFDLEETFILEDQMNGNVEKMPYHPPTPDELRAAERRQKVATVQERLAERLVDEGVDIDQLIAAAKGTNAPAAPASTKPAFPKHIAGAKWELSNGENVTGNRQVAEAAEAALVAPPPEDDVT